MNRPRPFDIAASARLVLAAVVLTAAFPAVVTAAGVEIVSHGLPGRVEAGSTLEVVVELRNVGPETWQPENGFKLSYHWLGQDGEIVVWDGVRTELPAAVAAGDVVRLEASVEVPQVAGPLGLRWDVVQEGVRWLSEGDPAVPAPIAVEVERRYAYSIVEGGAPRWMVAGGADHQALVLRNEGLATWSAGGDFALSYHWRDRSDEVVEWDGLRTSMPRDVPAGGEVEIRARVQAPRSGGRYSLEWDMVHEGIAWFSQFGGPVTPSSPVIVVRTPPGDLALWALTSLAAALLATAVASRGSTGCLATLMAVADLLWCLGALVVKQVVVVHRAGQVMSGSGHVLTAAGLALVLLPLLLIPRRTRVWVCFAVAVGGTLMLFADLLYGRFFGDVVSVAVLGAAGQSDEIVASAASLVTPDDLWFWIDLLAGLVLVAAVIRVPMGVDKRSRRLAILGMATLLVAGCGAAVAVGRSGRAPFDQVFRSIYVAREVGVLNFHAVDTGRAAVRRIWRRPLSQDDREAVSRWFRERSAQRSVSGPWFSAAESANVVMVQAESLQDFIIDLEVRGQEITPFLNRWAERSLRFTNVTDQTAQGRSSDSELATQVSLLPPPTGAVAFLYPANRFTGLASVLGDRGYHTLSAVAFSGSFWNRRLTHPAFGYSESLFDDAFAPGEPVGWGLNDRDFFSQMVDRLAALPQPFCAYLLTLSLHHPFEGFPDHLKELELGELEGSPLGNYLHTMRFFDRAFSSLISGLERSGLADSTMVALWGDHDAGLEWTATLAELTGQRHDAAGWYLSQRVPLLISTPGAARTGRRFDEPAGHQDVAPTLAALLGVDPEPFAWMGRNLLGRPGDAPVVGEYQCWRDAHRLFLQGDGSLEGGSCRALPGLEELPPSACAVGFDDARRQVEMSRLVLEHDLQQEISRRLAAE